MQSSRPHRFRLTGLSVLLTGALVSLSACQAARPRSVAIPAVDGVTLQADEYPGGRHAVVLAHGGRFTKESWRQQAQVLAQAGFRVLAFDFRGYGASRGGLPRDPYEHLDRDVLGAVRYLRDTGATTVSVIGGSLGGWAAGEAAANPQGRIDRLVLLGSSGAEHPERMRGRKLFLTTRDDLFADGTPRLLEIQEAFERATEPKAIIILEGAAHAQHVFDTEQGERAMEEILRFLSAP